MFASSVWGHGWHWREWSCIPSHFTTLYEGDDVVSVLVLDVWHAEGLPPDVDISDAGKEHITDHLLCVGSVGRLLACSARRRSLEQAGLGLAPYSRSKSPYRLIRSLRHLEKLCSADPSGHGDDGHGLHRLHDISHRSGGEVRVSFNNMSPRASLAHWKSCTGAACSLMSEPDLKVSHRRAKAFHVSWSTPISIVGLVSFGPRDVGTWVWAWERACREKSWPTRASLRSSVS